MAALALAILVTAVSFTLLTGSAEASKLHVRGTLKSSYRAAYDILVRPPGNTTALEREQGLVRPNFLSGIFGGITVKDYDKVRRLPGVDVAAPIANLGYFFPFANVGIDLDQYLSKAPVQLFRIRGTWLAANGTSRYPVAGDAYVYFTRRHQLDANFEELIPGRSIPPRVCAEFYEHKSRLGPFVSQPTLSCYSSQSPDAAKDAPANFNGAIPSTAVGTVFSLAFPVLVAAIDPREEARLVHLDGAIVSGRYLREGETSRIVSNGPIVAQRAAPAIASDRTYVAEHLVVTVDRLDVPSSLDVPDTLASRRAYGFVTGLRARRIATRVFTSQSVYRDLLAKGNTGRGRKTLQSFFYWTTSSVGYRKESHSLRPLTVRNPIGVWQTPFIHGTNGTYFAAPTDNADLQFRRLHPHIGSRYISNGVIDSPTFQVVGQYNPSKLPGFSPLSKVPLETYYPPRLTSANAASRRVLGASALLPSQNVGDYISQPPLLLTTLQGLRPFLNSKYFSNSSGRAPISAVRVKVKGVTGPDKLSQARVRAVAQEIHDRTGLQVDITAGSSPHALVINLPRGRFGRPELLLREGWSKKGASIRYLRAVDRKSLLLFALILVVCAFFLGNGALASVRARRAEIGTLLTFGWSAPTVFVAILSELGLIGTVAGIAGTGLAAVLVALFGLSVPLWRVVLVLPLAIAVALAAGFPPAWLASRGSPLDAMRPPVTQDTRTGHPRRLIGLAFLNLRRLPGRAIVGAAGLVIGVAALTVLIGIQRAFQGVLVDTVLGNAISVQVRRGDLVAGALTVALAGLGVADVLYLNLRERSAELATLRTLGWRDRDVIALVALEGMTLGILGSAAGGIAGLALSVGILHVPVTPVGVAAGIAVGGGIAVAVAASLLPLSQLARMAPATVLAEE